MNSLKPPEIKGKLEFGNPEQIKALKQYQSDVLEAEEEAAKQEFEVTVNFSGSYTKTYRAVDKDEAKMMAEDDFDPFEGDCDIDDVEVEEA